MAWVALNPMDAHADGGAAYHGQVQGGGWISDPAPIFSGGDIEPEMEAIFDSPMKPVGGHHLRGRHLFQRTGTDQPIRFDFKVLAGFSINEPRQATSLFHKREAGLFGCDIEPLEAAGFNTATVQFHCLGGVIFRPRGKRRAVTRSEVAARFPGWSADCL